MQNVDIDSETENQLLQSDNESNQDNLTSNVPLHEMITLLKDIKQSHCTKDDFKTFSKQMNNRLDGVITAQDENISTLVKRMDDCEKATASAQYQLELDKQRQLKNNISIIGIPNTNGEKLVNMVLKLLSKVGC